MYRSIFVILAVVLSTAVQAEKLVPFKVDLPSAICGFPGVQFPEDTVVLAAGGLGGKEIDFQIDQSGYNSTQIDVVVNYPGKPVALMLGASLPTIWNIGWTEGTNIVAVFASGYHRQRVAGIRTDTPLLVSSYEDKGPCSTSAFSYEKLNLHESFVASFQYGQITNVSQATNEQKISQILYSRPISRIFSVRDNEGKVLIGDTLGASQLLRTSTTTPPKSFYDKNSPLAGEAALEQAVRNKILRRATLTDAEKWIKALKRKYALQSRQPPDIPPDLNNAYVVLKQFTYPAGLYGGHSATFYIPEGIPQPSGNFGHSKIYDLNSISLECRGDSPCGQGMIHGSIGKGSTEQTTTFNAGSGMGVIFKETPNKPSDSKKFLKNVLPLSSDQPPRELASGTEVILISGYKSDGETVKVVIDRPGANVLLVLTSYEKITWEVLTSPQTKIAGIVTAGHESSTIVTTAQTVGYLATLPYASETENRKFTELLVRLNQIFRVTKVDAFRGHYSLPYLVIISKLDLPSDELTLTGPLPQQPDRNFSFDLVRSDYKKNGWTLTGPSQQKGNIYIDKGLFTLSNAGDMVFKPEAEGIRITGISGGEYTDVLLPPTFPRFSYVEGIVLDTKRGIVTVASQGGEGFLYRFDVKGRKWIDFRPLNNINILSLSYDSIADRYVGWTDDGKLIFISGEGEEIMSKKVINLLPGFQRLYDKNSSSVPKIVIAPHGNDIALIYISGLVVKNIWSYNVTSQRALLTYQRANAIQ